MGSIVFQLGFVSAFLGLTFVAQGALTPKQKRSFDRDPYQQTTDGRNFWRRHRGEVQVWTVASLAVAGVGGLLHLAG